MSNQVTTKQTGINIASQWALNITNIAVNFFLIGYVIAKVGAEYYGGWTLIISIIGYLSILDSGMSVAIQHYVARFSASGEKSRLISLFSSACVVYGLAAVVAMLLCFGVSIIYPMVFPKVPVQAAAECVIALRWVAVSMLIFMLNMPVRGALLGLQRHYVRNAIEILSLLVRAGTVLISFYIFGPSLAHLGMAFFAAALVRFVLSRAALRLIEPNLCFRLSFVTRSSLRDVFSYGGHSIFWSFVTVVVRESGPIVANIMLSSTAATFFFVGNRLVVSLGSFVTSPHQVFMPIASSLMATKQNSRLRSVLIRGTRMCCLFAFSTAVVLILFGRPILFHWVKFQDITPYLVVVIMTIGRISTWMFGIHLSMLKGLRILWPITNMLIVCMVACLVLMPFLAYFYGVIGLSAGLILPLFLAYLFWAPSKICAVTGMKIYELLVEVIPVPFIVGIILAAIGWVFVRFWVPVHLWILIIELGILLLVFFWLAITIGLDNLSRNLVWSKLKTVTSKRIRLPL